ncbi:hypothetical protein IFM89_004601 [Coptis chinensis]|uniref:Uncharacterized protein n=1 Tax=Coptis chinensis TaxID=261450 RepID=A0A835LGF7_9MAGN|nr:hypothetical protein IFM89_004601 [Coptis chinensis]
MDKTQTTSTSERAAFAEVGREIQWARQGFKQGETGRKESMGNGGTVHGGKVTMALVRCTSTEKVVMESTGTLMFSRTHGMKGTRISISNIALRTQRSYEKFINHHLKHHEPKHLCSIVEYYFLQPQVEAQPQK